MFNPQDKETSGNDHTESFIAAITQQDATQGINPERDEPSNAGDSASGTETETGPGKQAPEKKSYSRAKIPYPGDDEIRRLYLEENYRGVDIAKKYGISMATTNRWIKKSGCNRKAGRAPVLY